MERGYSKMFLQPVIFHRTLGLKDRGKNPTSKHHSSCSFFNLKFKSCFHIIKKIRWIQKYIFSAYIEFLGPKVWKCQALLLIISWSEHFLEYAIFFRLSVRSFWDILSQILMKNGEARAKTRSQIFFLVKNPNSNPKLQEAKRGPFWPIQVLPMVLGDDPRWS